MLWIFASETVNNPGWSDINFTGFGISYTPDKWSTETLNITYPLLLD